MSTVVKMRTFPIASEILSTLATRASTTSLSLPRNTLSYAVFKMIGTLVCFLAGLYIATQMYSGALYLFDSQLPKAFGVVYAAAYLFQLFVGYLEHRDEQRWKEAARAKQ